MNETLSFSQFSLLCEDETQLIDGGGWLADALCATAHAY